MKLAIYRSAMIALLAVIVLDCGKKKSTEPTGIALDTAVEQLNAAKDVKATAAAVETLVTTLTALKEKNPDILKDRSKFADSHKAFMDVYGDAMVKYAGNPDFAAAEQKLLPTGIFQ